MVYAHNLTYFSRLLFNTWHNINVIQIVIRRENVISLGWPPTWKVNSDPPQCCGDRHISWSSAGTSPMLGEPFPGCLIPGWICGCLTHRLRGLLWAVWKAEGTSSLQLLGPLWSPPHPLCVCKPVSFLLGGRVGEASLEGERVSLEAKVRNDSSILCRWFLDSFSGLLRLVYSSHPEFLILKRPGVSSWHPAIYGKDCLFLWDCQIKHRRMPTEFWSLDKQREL